MQGLLTKSAGISDKQAGRHSIRAEVAPDAWTCPECQTVCAYESVGGGIGPDGQEFFLRQNCLCETRAQEQRQAAVAEREAKMQEEARRARIVKSREASGFYGALWQRTFEAYDVRRAGLDVSQKRAHKTLWDWARTFKAGETEKGFILTSPSYGCGKTHLAVAAGLVVLELGYRVKYISLSKWLGEQRQEFQKARRYGGDTDRDGSDVGKVGAAMKAAVGADLLIVDDFGAEQIRQSEEGDWARQQIFTLLDDRANHARPILVTTNLDSAGIAARIGLEHGDRCASRLLQMARWFHMDGPDGRMQ